MDDQQSYKSSDLIEEEIIKRYIEYNIKKLKDLLNEIKLEYHIENHIKDLELLLEKAAKKLEERINPPEINGSIVENLGTTLSTNIELNCKKHSNEFMCYGYNIEMLFDKEFLIHKYDIKKKGIFFRKIYTIRTDYTKEERIKCHSNSQDLLYKIQCTQYSDNSPFELFNPDQSKSFIEDTINSIVDTFYILNPQVKELTYTDEYHTTIKASAFIDFNKLENNPKINIYGNKVEYYTHRFNATINWP
jgi:hypothetical protein